MVIEREKIKMANSTQILKDLHQILFSESSTKFIRYLISAIFFYFNKLFNSISHLIFSLLTFLYNFSTMTMLTNLNPSLLSNYYNALLPNLNPALLNYYNTLIRNLDPSLLLHYYNALFSYLDQSFLSNYCNALLSNTHLSTLLNYYSALKYPVKLLSLFSVRWLWLLHLAVVIFLLRVTCRCVFGTRVREERGSRYSGKMMKAPGSGGKLMDRSTFVASPKAYFTGLRAGSRVRKMKK